MCYESCCERFANPAREASWLEEGKTARNRGIAAMPGREHLKKKPSSKYTQKSTEKNDRPPRHEKDDDDPSDPPRTLTTPRCVDLTRTKYFQGLYVVDTYIGAVPKPMLDIREVDGFGKCVFPARRGSHDIGSH